VSAERRAVATGSAYRNYLVGWLTALYTFNFMDLVAFFMAIQSIKTSLHLSDAALGLVGGLAYSSFYSIFGVGLGRWADVGNRVTVLSVTRIVWAVFVILTSRAHSFSQLFIARMGVAAGESGCIPPAYSLIGDHFPRAERPRALAILFLGIPLATVLGYFGAGWLIQREGWRAMFAIMGLPGFALAAITWATLKEPRKANDFTPARAKSAVEVLPLWQTTKRLHAIATYRYMLLALVVSFFFSTGLQQWESAFFMRTYGMQPDVLGEWLAMAYGIPGIVGTLLGGMIASRWAGGNERAQLLGVGALFCSMSLIFPFVFLTHDILVAFGLTAVFSFASAIMSAPMIAPLQAVVPPRTRALSFVILYLFASLVGSGLGPLVAGALSDALRGRFGADSLRYALALMSPWFFFCGWFAWRASKTVDADIAAVRDEEETEWSEVKAVHQS
jgi:predicted MFS family arabinose efflux permease